MHPEIVSIGPLTVRTYGLAMASAFLISFWLATRRAPREQIDPELVLDCFLPLFMGAVVGGRLLYVVTDIDSFIDAPLEVFKIWKGGLVFYGGFLGGMVGTFIYLKARKFSFWRMMDLMAPYAGLGYAIHRVFGCFLGFGCCYGKPTDLPWGVTFPEGAPASRAFGAGMPVHPTQLYEALNGLLIMAAVMIYRRRPHRVGRPSALFLFIYAVLRFVIEFFRGDSYRGFLGSLSTSQWLSIPIFITGLVLWFRKTETIAPLDKDETKKFKQSLSGEKEEKRNNENNHP